MALIDELTIHLKAGDGGDGVVRWLHLKGKEFSGPAGGDGGEGGDVVVRAVRDLTVLEHYSRVKKLRAEDGENGRSKEQEGKNGEDLVLELPVGSVITRRGYPDRYELLREDEEHVLLKGGSGGLGNSRFKSSTNTKPEEYTQGETGGKGTFDIELKLIADAGLIGLPNAGKSSLLNALTGARSKVGGYPFTTLEPHLGSLYGFILADIPGLIEHASEGKGLGVKFLRHVERTRILFHCIASNTEDPINDYKTIRGELKAYSKELAQKPEVVVLTKIDEVSTERLKELEKEFSQDQTQVLTVSILDDESLKQFQDSIIKILRSRE